MEGARFLGVWVDEGLGWKGQVGRVKDKVGQLLGVLWRARLVLGGRSLLALYNGLVLPHLQYCLMVWGGFAVDGNGGLGAALLSYQKRFAGLISGQRGRFHADPHLARLGMLKVGDLYRQQLRVHAWRFLNGRLPQNQAAMLSRVADVHRYGTRAARGGLFVSTRDHRSVAFRVPREWGSMGESLRTAGSLGSFKRGSRSEFLGGYAAFRCSVPACFVCLGARGAAGNGIGGWGD